MKKTVLYFTDGKNRMDKPPIKIPSKLLLKKINGEAVPASQKEKKQHAVKHAANKIKPQ
jgi:hypothetical protein